MKSNRALSLSSMREFALPCLWRTRWHSRLVWTVLVSAVAADSPGVRDLLDVLQLPGIFPGGFCLTRRRRNRQCRRPDLGTPLHGVVEQACAISIDELRSRPRKPPKKRADDGAGPEDVDVCECLPSRIVAGRRPFRRTGTPAGISDWRVGLFGARQSRQRAGSPQRIGKVPRRAGEVDLLPRSTTPRRRPSL